MHAKLESKRREFIDIALNLTEQRIFLESILDETDQLQKETDKKALELRLRELSTKIRQRMSFAVEKD